MRKQLCIFGGKFTLLLSIFSLVYSSTDASSLESEYGNSKNVKRSQAPTAPLGQSKVDCFPESQGGLTAVSADDCVARGCTFDVRAPQGQPVCYYSQNQYSLAVTSVKVTPLGLSATLTQSGKAPFGGDIKQWTFTFESRGDNIARFTFDTSANKRFKVPINLNLPDSEGLDPKYELKITNFQNFAFQIIRKETGTVIWDTGIGPGNIILSDQFLQIGTKLPSRNVYGLGEHVHETFRHDLTKSWASFARDNPPGDNGGGNLYGTQPVYHCVEDDKGNTHGVLMLNSNAQEYDFSTSPSLTFRTIGGILDFYVFMGPSPEQVVQQYTGVVGRPVMPAYWSLGFQLSRYGYNNISNLKDAVESTASYDIPHDVQFVDIDHMDEEKIFTVGEKKFPGLNDYFKELQGKGMKIIFILDPCINSEATSYYPYLKMKAIDGNIKWGNDVIDQIPDDSKDSDGSLLGYVWPHGKTVFPDFFKPSVREAWKELIVDYRNNLTFDGLWIDMNEPANFDTNLEKPFNWPSDRAPWSLKCPKNKWEDPPYRTKAAYFWDNPDRKARLSDKTICMTSVQGINDTYLHYDVHNMFGWSQSEPTLQAARMATGTRSIIISRSTFVGSGQYVGHWLGDNSSKWKHMQNSIIGILEFNLFGIPYIGADICGFFGETTVEMCKRWMQLGAFYTFNRNHNGLNNKPQGPGQMGDELGYASRDILRIRYQLLPYLYLLFHQAHTQGSTVIRPMHHEFPDDAIALSINRQFLWGAHLLISPILTEKQTKLDYYLPKGKWYNYYTGQGEELSVGAWKTMPVTTDSMPLLHLRGGSVIVCQEYANNTHFSRQKPLSIVAALDGDEKARGKLFWDDGSSVDTFETNAYYMASLSIANNTLLMSVLNKELYPTKYDNLSFEQARIMGVRVNVKSLTIDGTPVTSQYFNQTGEVLDISMPQLPMRNDFKITWSG